MMRIAILFTLLPLLAMGQQRGFKPVTVAIEGTPVELYRQSHALIIGISKYTNGWPSLPGVLTDVEAVRSALEQNGFNVVVERDLNKQQMDKAFSDFIAKHGQDVNNRLLFYFAGHGHTVKASYGDKLGYIVPSDAPNPNVNQTEFQLKAMEMAQIEIYAKRIQSKHALFMFDACFSGALFATTRAVPEVISYKTREPVRQFITSGNEDETVPDKSIFREQFVTALTSNYADSNKDGYITGTELGEYLQSTVINYSRSAQHPQYGKIRHPALDKGDFVFQLAAATPPATPSIGERREVRPEIGAAVSATVLGSIELTTEISGDLYLDGNKLTSVQANTIVPINRIAAGNHTLEIRGGTDQWQAVVTVNRDGVAKVTAPRSASASASVSATLVPPALIADSRDGISYKTVRIGNQVWLDDNANYSKIKDTWCFNNDADNCVNFGRLYTWESARAACPAGWRLPTKEEVEAMLNFLGIDEKKSYGELVKQSPNFGKVAGVRSEKENFTGTGVYSQYWTSTPNTGTEVWSLKLHFRFKTAKLEPANITSGFSVRCIRE